MNNTIQAKRQFVARQCNPSRQTVITLWNVHLTTDLGTGLPSRGDGCCIVGSLVCYAAIVHDVASFDSRLGSSGCFWSDCAAELGGDGCEANQGPEEQ